MCTYSRTRTHADTNTHSYTFISNQPVQKKRTRLRTFARTHLPTRLRTHAQTLIRANARTCKRMHAKTHAHENACKCTHAKTKPSLTDVTSPFATFSSTAVSVVPNFNASDQTVQTKFVEVKISGRKTEINSCWPPGETTYHSFSTFEGCAVFRSFWK